MTHRHYDQSTMINTQVTTLFIERQTQIIPL